MTHPTVTEEDYEHAEGCTGCHTVENNYPNYLCHRCGHWRNDTSDYSHGYYCTDCVLAIHRWREAEDEYRTGLIQRARAELAAGGRNRDNLRVLLAQALVIMTGESK